MQLYLSSYKLGNKTNILKDWIKLNKNNRIALIPNAGDGYDSPPEIRTEKINATIRLLDDLGFDTSVLDLRNYFGKEKELEKATKNFRAFFVSGGNTFVLRQAMKLSGFDKHLTSLKNKDNYLYGGWSAGICVLAPNLKGIELCDEPYSNPYKHEPTWNGLGLLDYMPLPHYKSNHPESKMIEDCLEYCKEVKMPYKTLSDGEVIVRNTRTNKEQIFRLDNLTKI